MVDRSDRVIVRFGVAAISVAFYAFSMLLPVFRVSETDPWFKICGGEDKLPGILALLLGWVTVFDGLPAWMANPVFLAALILLLLGQYWPSLVFSLFAVILGLTTLTMSTVPLDESGHQHQIHSLASAFYFWQASFVVIALGCWLQIHQRRVHAQMQTLVDVTTEGVG